MICYSIYKYRLLVVFYIDDAERATLFSYWLRREKLLEKKGVSLTTYNRVCLSVL